MSSAIQYFPPDFKKLPSPVYLRLDTFATHGECLAHTHPWGQLSYCATGVMQLDIAGQTYLSPPQYGIWIPPDREHHATVRQAVTYHSAYIDASLCRQLPDVVCALEMKPLLKSILADFAARRMEIPSSDEDIRLAQVLLDQIRLATITRNYLPGSTDPVLVQMLNALNLDPASPLSLQQWAERLHMTERTLARRCRRELGMSFSEWRQRLRFLRALQLLETGESVQGVALELGYSTSSAFISMFQRQSGTTPDQFRRQAPPA
jgi:AraC-like DNA-binding protein